VDVSPRESGMPPAAMDGVARVARALQCSPPSFCPILLHTGAGQSAVHVLYSLLSIHRSGVVLLAAPASRSLQVLAKESKDTPRRARTSLVVLHASQHLPILTFKEAVASAASAGNWLLLTSAHLRPDVVTAGVRLSSMLQESGSPSPHFRVFMSCPSEFLSSIPCRPGMVTVMCGGEGSPLARATRLLRVAESPLADELCLIPACMSGDVGGMLGTDARAAMYFTPPSLLLLQLLAVRVAAAVAEAEDRLQSSRAYGVLACATVPTVTDRDFLHALHVVCETVRISTDARKLCPRQLQAAILQARCDSVG
jgi:hypothetical protein